MKNKINLDIKLLQLKLLFIEDGWEEKGEFLYKKFLPLYISLKNKLLSNKNGGVNSWIEVSVIHNKSKNYFFHLEKLLCDLIISGYMPVFGYWGEMGYFREEYIHICKEYIKEYDLFIYKCYVNPVNTEDYYDVDITKPIIDIEEEYI